MDPTHIGQIPSSSYYHENNGEMKKKKFHKHRHSHGANAPPSNVSTHHWKDMLNMSVFASNLNNESNKNNNDIDDEDLGYDISKIFKKRECKNYVRSMKESQRCGCGRLENEHSMAAIINRRIPYSDTEGENRHDNKDEEWTKKDTIRSNERWSIKNDTVLLSTDAYGTIEFQGGPRPIKAQYVRLSFDTECSSIIHLLQNIWQIPPPKLIISIHGGTGNFNLQSKLSRLFRNGLVKSASTTGAWIITSGVENGLTRQVAAAIENAQNSIRNKTKIISIGIAPWGLLKRREDFIGQDNTVLYRKMGSNVKSRFITLNNRHSYFLFTDNGTIGKHGSEVILRRRLEMYINEKQTIVSGGRTVPVVCVMIEGGTYSIKTALQYVTSFPKTPVVVCDGSGRASDLIALTHQYIQDDNTLPDSLRKQLLSLIESIFQQTKEDAEHLMNDLINCVSQKRMVTIFKNSGENRRDLDHAILTALLKGYNLTPPEQLSLALAWNRVDIARSEIFIHGIEWNPNDLHNIMMEALVSNRVDFVRLLLENGVDMQTFLTIGRLEDLYNTDKGPTNTLFYIVRDVTKIKHGYTYKLPHIGLAMEKLIGNGFKSYYTSEEFIKKYNKYKNTQKLNNNKKKYSDNLASVIFPFAMMKKHDSSNNTSSGHWKNEIKPSIAQNFQKKVRSVFINVNDEDEIEKPQKKNSSSNISSIHQFKDDSPNFRYPFSELMVWAVLTKRHEMARCMWEHGEESMAKALVACCLNKNLAKEAREDYLDIEISDDLKRNADEFKQLSLDLLDCCYRQDDDKTLQLLTYELKYWGNETNLSLAVVANNKQFIAHPCCQMLLADLWHGGMRIRSNPNLKVIIGILFFPSIFTIEFKSKEELMLQPQTAAEHENDLYDTSSSEEENTTSESEGNSTSDSEIDNELFRTKSFFGSTQSLHFSSIFQGKLRRSRKDTNRHRRQSITSISSNSKNTNLNKMKILDDSITSIDESVKLKETTNRRRMSSTCKEILDISKLTTTETQERRGSIQRNRSGTTSSIKKINSIETTAKPTVRLKSKQIKAKRKIYEFFFAPITTFWTWFLSFFIFMAANTYVLLVRTPKNPTILEWILFIYVISYGLEELRKLFMSEPTRIRKKLTFFFSNTWNWLSTIGVVGYIIGFIVRLASPPTGRVILAVDYSVWCLKILDYLTVHPTFGPYITMVGKMTNAMKYHITLLFISLLSFGTARQSILVNDQEWNWELLRNIFYKPYFMLYGEVYAGEIDLCTDEGTNCVPGNFIPPIMMTIFLLIANLLLISMLMATFNHIFDEVNLFAKNYWLFQRYHQVMKYESTPVLPPPLTFIYHVYWIGKYMFYQNTFNIWKLLKKLNIITDKTIKNSHLFDCSLKLFLTLSQVEKLHDFEEESMEVLTFQQEHLKKTAVESKIKNTSDNTETILRKMADINRSEGKLKETVTVIEKRLLDVENNQDKLLNNLQDIINILPNTLSQNKETSKINLYSTKTTSDNNSLIFDNTNLIGISPNNNKQIEREKKYTSMTSTINVKNYLNTGGEEETDVPDVYTEDDKYELDYEEYSN
ncbi:Transient receptor potential cation channel subfamily M member 1 [Strongyloides ratti]|uniref:Transient receptor potential cation channel subfamily M member 1 n=1 Tax=Strongyloides ratti TaxID=34506 RepID=A0A090LR10_STRRB|nr:Transient receptor potential cation channel subfamily M member 1 [Strongyloides ratti]CEF70041.1 Transient receptor potential cation channel subfamily M member 1 [Strongyloides ratti]